MYNRKRLDRERLEVYYAQLMLAYRPILFIGGILLFSYALATMLRSILMGGILLLLSVFPLLVFFSYPFLVLIARLGAWIATLGSKS